MTKEQRSIFRTLATEFDLKHESKGKWRPKILYIYKDQLSMYIQRNSQAISSALNYIAAESRQINQKVLEVIDAGPSVDFFTE